MHRGEHFLLLLYPPSRLGFTSPVGGPLGEVLLDGAGKNVAAGKVIGNLDASAATGLAFQPPRALPALIPVNQMERAIRAARSSTEK